MGFKMMGGKSPKEKTGSGIPLSMKSPLYKKMGGSKSCGTGMLMKNKKMNE
tara:strand:+ start:324 stop:476 length:153 start_codon:yes stop_codon:yes gene_type:complete